MNRIEKEAASAGVTAKQLTDSCLKDLPAAGLRENENEQQRQIAAIAYTILKLPIEVEGCPLVCDYLATDGDIQAEVFIADGDFRVEVATPKRKDWIETLDWDEAHEALAVLEREPDLVPDSAELVEALNDRLGYLVRETLHEHPEWFRQLPGGYWELTEEGKRVGMIPPADDC
jgi:hypothetical protein